MDLDEYVINVLIKTKSRDVSSTGLVLGRVRQLVPFFLTSRWKPSIGYVVPFSVKKTLSICQEIHVVSQRNYCFRLRWFCVFCLRKTPFTPILTVFLGFRSVWLNFGGFLTLGTSLTKSYSVARVDLLWVVFQRVPPFTLIISSSTISANWIVKFCLNSGYLNHIARGIWSEQSEIKAKFLEYFCPVFFINRCKIN